MFLIVKNGQVPAKGALVAFKLEPTPVYPEVHISVKRLGGVPGDLVTRRENVFYINGERRAVAKARAKSDRLLRPGPTGRLSKAHYWVYTESPDSYDSRYAEIGWITKTNMIGPAYVVL